MRCDSASLAAVAAIALAGACATSPPPLPPRRAAAEPIAAAPPSVRPPDLETPTAPPIRHRRYLGWTLAADAVSIVPLVYWMVRPERAYLPLPALALSPLIHIAYGEPGKAMASLFLRGAMVGVVYAAGRHLDAECTDRDGWLCVPTGSFLLADVAIVSVVVVDSVFLARTTRSERGWLRLPVLPIVGGGTHGLAYSARF